MVADECKLQSEPNPFYRWNQRNKPYKMKLTRKKKSVSFYGGISMNTGKVLAHQCDWQDSGETIKFLDEIKREYEGRGEILLVWDNASWHKSKLIKQWLEDNPGIVRLMNFPPYSPDLNPSEHLWKEMRRYLSKNFEGRKFSETVDAACGYLKREKFNYKF